MPFISQKVEKTEYLSSDEAATIATAVIVSKLETIGISDLFLLVYLAQKLIITNEKQRSKAKYVIKARTTKRDGSRK